MYTFPDIDANSHFVILIWFLWNKMLFLQSQHQNKKTREGKPGMLSSVLLTTASHHKAKGLLSLMTCLEVSMHSLKLTFPDHQEKSHSLLMECNQLCSPRKPALVPDMKSITLCSDQASSRSGASLSQSRLSPAEIRDPPWAIWKQVHQWHFTDKPKCSCFDLLVLIFLCSTFGHHSV